MDEFQVHSGIKWQGDVGVVQYGQGDSSMVVMFYERPVRNQAKSAEQGRPFFENKTYVRIHPPGERLNIIDKEATDAEKRRFPIQWSQFTQNRPQTADGTPIDMLFAANPAVAEMLKASGVHTVEQCAGLSAHAIETIGMGAQQWVNDATRYLEVADKGVKASQLKHALDEKDREINSLKHKLDMVTTELDHIRAAQANSVTMQDVQQLLANQGGQGRRGVFPPGTLNQNFDAQTSQINATHVTRDVEKKAGKQKIDPPKRSRARIT